MEKPALVGRLGRAQTFLRVPGINIAFSREGRAGMLADAETTRRAEQALHTLQQKQALIFAEAQVILTPVRRAWPKVIKQLSLPAAAQSHDARDTCWAWSAARRSQSVVERRAV